MPSFERSGTADAPAEEVWKLLYDPVRIPQWWSGIESVTDLADTAESGDSRTYTMYPTGYPDYPMPQLIRSTQQGTAVVVSCLVNELEFAWRLEPLSDGRTRISVRVEIPDAEAHRVEAQQSSMDASIARLADLAAASMGRV